MLLISIVFEDELVIKIIYPTLQDEVAESLMFLFQINREKKGYFRAE